jgi:RNA polymerase primary sigma factor
MTTATQPRVDVSSVSLYMQELNRYPLLSEGELEELMPKAHSGDKHAFNRIVQGNLRFVVQIASEYAQGGVTFSDLLAEGNMGLIKAVEKFDASLGYKFTTYAVWWIRNAIQKSIRSHKHPLRLPSNRLEDLDKLRKTADRMSQRMGRTVLPEEAGPSLEMNRRRTEVAVSASDGTLSLDTPIDESEKRTLHEYMPDDRMLQDETFIRTEASQHVRKAMENLKERDAAILTMTFGLQHDEPLTLSQIGDRLGISKERVRQLRDRALRELKAMLSGELGYAN